MDVSRLHQHGLETMSRQARVQPLRHRPGFQADQVRSMWRQDGSDRIRIGRHHALKDNMILAVNYTDCRGRQRDVQPCEALHHGHPFHLVGPDSLSACQGLRPMTASPKTWARPA